MRQQKHNANSALISGERIRVEVEGGIRIPRWVVGGKRRKKKKLEGAGEVAYVSDDLGTSRAQGGGMSDLQCVDFVMTYPTRCCHGYRGGRGGWQVPESRTKATFIRGSVRLVRWGREKDSIVISASRLMAVLSREDRAITQTGSTLNCTWIEGVLFVHLRL